MPAGGFAGAWGQQEWASLHVCAGHFPGLLSHSIKSPEDCHRWKASWRDGGCPNRCFLVVGRWGLVDPAALEGCKHAHAWLPCVPLAARAPLPPFSDDLALRIRPASLAYTLPLLLTDRSGDGRPSGDRR
jgi:hypothetical protein